MILRALSVALLSFSATFVPHPSASSELPYVEHIHFIIPGGAGGGWDRTARGVGSALTRAGLLGRATFENMSGGGGAKGIAHIIEMDDPDTLLVNSTPIVVRALQRVFPQTYRDLTPIASVIGDYSVVAVRKTSVFQDLHALLTAQRDTPRRVAFAGGSVPGGTDHIFAAMLVQGFGSAAQTTKYIPYDAGGKAMAGLLSGEVQALSSGFGEVVDLADQDWVRILCIAAEARVEMSPATPTCIEAGAAEAVFVNWRGFFAGPGMTAQRAEQYRAMFRAMYTSPAWQETRVRHGWVDLFRPGEDFTALLNAQERHVGALMRELGLL